MKASQAAIARLGLAVAPCAAAAYGATPDPCALPTSAQAGAALGGVTVGPGKHLNAYLCAWGEAGKPMASGKAVRLHVLGPVGSMTPAQMFHNIKTPVPGFFPPAHAIVKTPVRGVGDDAVYERVGYGTPELSVNKGGNGFQISIHGLAGNQTSLIEAREKELALAVMAKLP